MGPSRNPPSSTQAEPVISPFPLKGNQPAKTGSCPCEPRGWMMVTPVRADSSSITVAYPTVTPGTSVIALYSPGVPSNGIPRSRARGLVMVLLVWEPCEGECLGQAFARLACLH